MEQVLQAVLELSDEMDDQYETIKKLDEFIIKWMGTMENY